MREVRAEIRINAPADRCLQGFINVETMRQWWGVDRGLVEPKPGGMWALAWERSEHGFRYVSTGRIKAYSSGKYLDIENLVYFNPDHVVFGPLRLTILVKTKNGGTHLSLVQDGYGEGPEWDWYYDAVLHAWPRALEALKKFLEK